MSKMNAKILSKTLEGLTVMIQFIYNFGTCNDHTYTDIKFCWIFFLKQSFAGYY
jgi:hypothetical protein